MKAKSKQSCRHIHLGSPTAKRNSYDVKFTTVTHAQSIFKTLAVTSIGSLDNSTPENSIPSKTVSQSSRTGSPSSGRLCLSLRTELHCYIVQPRATDFRIASETHQSGDGHLDDITIHVAMDYLAKNTLTCSCLEEVVGQWEATNHTCVHAYLQRHTHAIIDAYKH